MKRRDQLFEQFLRERVTSRTSRRRLAGDGLAGVSDGESYDPSGRNTAQSLITRADLIEFVVHLRKRG
jgi:hypothetical protein